MKNKKSNLPDEFTQTDLGNYNPGPLNLPKRNPLREPIRKSTKRYFKLLTLIYGVTVIIIAVLYLS